MKTKPKKAYWVTRDDITDLGGIEVWDKGPKPTINDKGYWGQDGERDNCYWICSLGFRRAFGISLKRGEIMKVEFSAKVRP